MRKTFKLAAALALPALLALTGGAAAQQKLRFAHVYETNEPYHKWAVWAAGEIARQTNNKIQMDIFPASQLGNEPAINQALPLGTIDMIYTGAAFAGNAYPPLSISSAPYMFKSYEHMQAYRKSELFNQLAQGYDKQTGNQILGITYYGQRHVTANKPIMAPADMKGMKLRVPQAPLFLMFTQSVGANATPIAFAEVYLALQQKTVDGQENPLPTIMAKKFYEVQSHVSLTGHISEALMVIAGAPLWGKLSDQEKKVFQSVWAEATDKCTDEIRQAELQLVAEFEKMGKTVDRPDVAAFRAAAVPLHNDSKSGAGWTKAQYDALQALAK
jgi:tripartite ATP-independent transporter DctP family solute receptor